MSNEPTSSEPLSKEDRRFALLLGAPAFALALCLATLSTYRALASA